MERLNLKYSDSIRAIKTLKEVLNEPFSVIVIDATIQRFEYTFEALWKFLKEYLKEREGIISNSPKSCFREFFKLDIIYPSRIGFRFSGPDFDTSPPTCPY